VDVAHLSQRIVFVSGGLAAARTAEQLRRAALTGLITIVSDEVHLPYDRPPFRSRYCAANSTM
jgi:NADPH-dependent 2,4-dienoyl-CoA reductase/sulfur reductase-like enzyme